ncbi:MAG TPA: O-antigen ligase family protein [Gemmatimonadales bacterium]|jgi:O-antigen ligase|nr:O-antigen ligase family protein [Gemmatimonadales bacterium]
MPALNATRAGAILAALAPAVLTLYFSFNAGGFFAGSTGMAATVLGVALVLRITLVEEPFVGAGRRLALAAGALGLFAAWTIASAFWSDGSARSIIEFDRALVYCFALVLFGCSALRRGTVARAQEVLAAALVVVCGAGLVTRVLPEVWTIGPNLANDRLSYPLTYWNAMGVIAALAATLLLHLTANVRSPAAVRVLAAGALPVVAGTLFFTFSRGGLAAAVVGLAAYVLVVRPRGLIPALLAAGPPTAIAVVFCYHADLLASANPTTSAAVAQGHDVALAVGLAALAAAGLRLLLLRLDRALAGARRPRVGRRRGLALAAAGAGAAVVAFAALGGPGYASDQYDRFVSGESIDDSADLRSRFVNPANNNRLDHWQVAIDAFEREPLHGVGAGTYVHEWARERDSLLKVEDAHSLYVEVLAELGVVGLALLVTALLALLAALAARCRGEGRQLWGVLLAMGMAWSVHAGLDWDWEMPAVTFWLFAFGGMALAQPGSRSRQPRRFARVALSVACLALIVTPALMTVSQGQLNRSSRAFESGDCDRAIDAALASTRAVPVRPEPLEMVAYCDVRAGEEGLAVRMMQGAVDRDPRNWRTHYGLALARGAAGQDPRPEARRAFELNPRDPLTREAVALFRGIDSPEDWRRRALRARLPVQ